MKQNLLLIDGSALLSIQYHATLPDELKKGDDPKFYPLIRKNKYGVYNNAIAGFFRVFGEMIKVTKATAAAVTFDIGTETLRKQACPTYKANRSERPYPLKMQTDILRTSLREIGVPVYTSDLYEGDDVIATIADKMKKSFDNICILTGDRDYFQLVGNNIMFAMYIPSGRKQDALEADKAFRLYGNYFLYDLRRVHKDMGVFPWQVPDFKALAGDTSDNIPGVKGIGDKSADSLLSVYKTVEDVFTAMDGMTEEEFLTVLKNAGISRPGGVYNALKADDAKESSSQAKKLATMYRNVPVGTLSPELLQLHIDKDKYNAFMEAFGLKVS